MRTRDDLTVVVKDWGLMGNLLNIFILFVSDQFWNSLSLFCENVTLMLIIVFLANERTRFKGVKALSILKSDLVVRWNLNNFVKII